MTERPATTSVEHVDIDRAILTVAFAHAPLGVGVCDEDGRFCAVNDALATLLGRPVDEILGRPFLTFVHPQERGASLAGYFLSVVGSAGRRASTTAEAELRAITGHGAVVWLAVSWTITPPNADGEQYGIVHLRDVTERREAQRQLAHARRWFQLSFDCAPIGIAVVGADGRLLQVNPALRSILGYPEASPLPQRFIELCHSADRAAMLEVLTQQHAGGLAVHESIKRLRHRGGYAVHTRCLVAATHEPDAQPAELLVQVEDLATSFASGRVRRDLQLRDEATGLLTRQALANQLSLTAGLPRSLLVISISAWADRDDADELLARCADALRDCCREGDLLARVGDREFAIAIDDSGAAPAVSMATRVTKAMNRYLAAEGATAPAVSVRAATDWSGRRPLTELVQRARAAVNIMTTTPDASSNLPASTGQTTARGLALDADLGRALRRGELHLHYQPIITLADGTMHSIEALSRWDHPSLGPIPTAEFVALAERGPAIHILTAWALSTACADLARWHAAYPTAADVAVAVNISAVSFAHLDFPDLVVDTLAAAGLRPGHLILEITETAVADPETSFLENAARLRRHGLRIAVDDFGAGYSSLARLATLPITELKIDRSLTAPSIDPNVGGALLRATVRLASDLDINLVAEGVETPEQLEKLRRYGCPYAQGNLLAAPRSADAIAADIASAAQA